MPASSRLAGVSARARLTNADEVMNTALGKRFARRGRRRVSRNERTRRSGSCLRLISRLRFAALLQALFSRHDVFEEILVLRSEVFRTSENLKAVAIADGPELDIR